MSLVEDLWAFPLIVDLFLAELHAWLKLQVLVDVGLHEKSAAAFDMGVVHAGVGVDLRSLYLQDLFFTLTFIIEINFGRLFLYTESLLPTKLFGKLFWIHVRQLLHRHGFFASYLVLFQVFVEGFEAFILLDLTRQAIPVLTEHALILSICCPYNSVHSCLHFFLLHIRFSLFFPFFA